MSPERQLQIKKVFQTAIEMDDRQRTVFLSKACTDDEMREAVERLLTGEKEMGKTIEDRELDQMIGRQFGSFRLIREIGRGGMGAVYLAERADGIFDQRVAVKLIKRGMDTEMVVRRFRNERQILATLSHPNITRLLDGGTGDSGLPYFVMEYVEGEPLYSYCDKRKLKISERLRIFRRICEAIQEAHRHKIIHRDLKPSNILVKASGEPKLLDFGIAKLLDPGIGATEMEPTATHLRMMTPQYASPEQISGEAVTTVSDIYSLGVLLYELLTGHRPYRVKSQAPYEIARAVREDEPARPSESLTGEGNLARSDAIADTDQTPTLDLIFDARSATFETLRNELSGDLDKIVLKALRKNPAERYRSASELIEDITDYLEKRPVKARSFDLPEYVSKKKTPTGNVEKSIAVLPLRFLGEPQTDDAYLSIGLADAMITRLSGVRRLIVRPTSSVLRFGEAEDLFAAGRELGVDFVLCGTIRPAGTRIRITAQLLDVESSSVIWTEKFDEDFTGVLELEDLVAEKVGRLVIPKLTGEEREKLIKRGTDSPAAYEAYLRGRYHLFLFTPAEFDKAKMYFEEAIALDPEYALAFVGIADYYFVLGTFATAPPLETIKKARAMAERAIAIDDSLGEAYAILGFTYFADLDFSKIEKTLLRAIELNPHYSLARVWYSVLLTAEGRNDEAVAEAKRGAELNPLSGFERQHYGWVLYHTRRFDEALAETRRLLKEYPDFSHSLGVYAWLLRYAGQNEESIRYANRAVELSENPWLKCILAASYAKAGQNEKAKKILAELEQVSSSVYVSPFCLAIAYCNLGDIDRTFKELEKSVEDRDVWSNWISSDPQLDVLRSDARYENLLRRMRTPQARSANAVLSASSRQPSDGEKSIAVLPLKLLSGVSKTGDSGEEFLGIGLTDALITRLSNVRRFVLRPTSSVLQYADSRTDPFEAGRKLEVDYILDGSIRRGGERIRVSVQLLSLKENATIWAANFDEKSSDVLELEDLISEKVSRLLIPKLTGEERRSLEKRGTNVPEAFEYYMRGRFHWNQFTPDALMKARTAFQTAISLDPGYALAHVGLADLYIWANIYGMIPPGEALPPAESAARRAIELDPYLGEAYASLGLTMQNRFGWAEAERLYKKSLELAPNYVHAHEWWSAQLIGHGRIEEGVKEIKIAERLDPLSLRTKTLVAWTLYQGHHYEDALKIGRQIVDMDKNYPQGYAQIGNNQLQLGQINEAVANFEKFNQMIPNSALAKYVLCHALVAAGRADEARAIFEEMKTLAAENYVKPYFLGMAYVALGELNAAFENFEKATAENDPWMLWFGTEPMLAKIRGDERYRNLMRKMNFPLSFKSI